MKSANSKESKTRKRKVALANLEASLKDRPKLRAGLNISEMLVPVDYYTRFDANTKRIEKEITTLKSRILN
jgi:hypothetical protein